MSIWRLSADCVMDPAMHVFDVRLAEVVHICWDRECFADFVHVAAAARVVLGNDLFGLGKCGV